MLNFFIGNDIWETFGGYRHFNRINGNLNLINETVLLLDYLINTVDSITSFGITKNLTSNSSET
jgi:hypothetical protein